MILQVGHFARRFAALARGDAARRTRTGRAVATALSMGISALICGCGAASAQNATVVNIPGPPIVSAVDANGVDLINGSFNFALAKLSIGGEGSGLSRVMVAAGVDNFYGAIVRLPYTGISTSTYNFNVVLGSGAESFSKVSASDPFTAWRRNGSALSCDSIRCLYTLGDGTVATFALTESISAPFYENTDRSVAYLTAITKPDGEVISITYPAGSPVAAGYPLTVSSSLGWMFKYKPPSNSRYVRVDALNTSVDYCSPTATSCPSTAVAWPYVSGLTDALGHQATALSISSYSPCPCNTGTPSSSAFYPLTLLTSFATPAGVTRTIDYDSDIQVVYSGDDGRMPEGGDPHWVSKFKVGASTWRYAFQRENPNAPNYRTNTVTDPNNNIRTIYVNIQTSQILSDTDALNRVTKYMYLAEKVRRVISPDATFDGAGNETGGYAQYTYDARGNVTEVRQVAKAGSGLADIVITAGYDLICSNPKTCNRPNWVKDALGGQTDYVYSPDHGGVLSETGPPVTDPVNGQQVRPQKRYTYTELYPKVRNSSGDLINSSKVWRLTKVSTCQSATTADPAACVGTANETVVEYAYNTNNLLKTSETFRAGNANTTQMYSPTNVWATTTYTYDNYGNLVVVDGPRADVDDRSYATYDILRRKVFEIGPDPDGGGILKRVVVKHHYDADGREDVTQTGSGSAIVFDVAVPTDVSDFAVQSFVRRTFDPATGLLTKTETVRP